MRIAKTYSHLNGEEYLIVHNLALYNEIKSVTKHIEAEAHRTKVSKEKGMKGKMLFNPVSINAAFKKSI